jgi:hypothetical protein
MFELTVFVVGLLGAQAEAANKSAAIGTSRFMGELLNSEFYKAG